MDKILYLGTRSVYNAGNSKNFSIPKVVLQELANEKHIKVQEVEVQQAEVYFNKETKELILKF